MKTKNYTTVQLNQEQHQQLLVLKEAIGMSVTFSLSLAVSEFIAKMETSDSVAGKALKNWMKNNDGGRRHPGS